MQQKFFRLLLPFFFLILCNQTLFAEGPLLTTFPYHQSSLNALKKLHTENCLEQEELEKWDSFSQEVCERLGVNYDLRTLFFTYLYGAQRDAAFLSYEAKDGFEGSFDPISVKIFKLFFPGEPLPENLKTDPYSEKLALIVMRNYGPRYAGDQNLPAYNWHVWGINPQALKISPPPPTNSPIWQKQLQAVVQAQKKVGEKELETIHYWTHQNNSTDGDWRTIVNNYLKENYEPLPKFCLVRSLVAMAITDAIIISQQTKNAYDIKRPYEVSPEVHLLTHKEKNSSYPSTHATIAAAVSDILCCFFPDESKHWETLATEGSLSRIWAGVHYPQDKAEGEKIGLQIAEQLLEPLHNSSALSRFDLFKLKPSAAMLK